MSTSIDTVFQTQWESEVFTAYQRQGSLLRGAVREKTITPGDTAKFPKYGTGSVGARGKHGLVPVMNASHTIVSVTVSDYYGGEYIDDLDELKTDIDERGQAAKALALAAGRKVDERIIAAIEGVSGVTTIAHGSVGFTKTKLLSLVEKFHAANVPEDGQKFCALAPQGWTQLLDLAEVKSRDYMTTMPWMDGYRMLDFMGIKFMMHTGLNITSTTRNALAWHRPAVGLAWVADLRSNFDWIAERAAYFAQVRISCEAVGIDGASAFIVQCTET